MFIGFIIAVPDGRGFVKMTAMPQLVAIFNGVGGGAASLVSLNRIHPREVDPPGDVRDPRSTAPACSSARSPSPVRRLPSRNSKELMTGRPVTYPGQQVINAIRRTRGPRRHHHHFWSNASTSLLWVLLALSFVAGRDLRPAHRWRGRTGVDLFAQRLHRTSPWRRRVFTLGSNLLIVAGVLVGASGILLTRLMSKAMGRSLSNVLFSAFGSVVHREWCHDARRWPKRAVGYARGHWHPAGLRQSRGHHPGLRPRRRPGPARLARVGRVARRRRASRSSTRFTPSPVACPAT